MKLRRLLVIVAALAIPAFAGPGSAARDRCTLSPFYFAYAGTPVFSSLPSGVVRITWRATGMTTLSCPESPFDGQSVEVLQSTVMDYSADKCLVTGRVSTLLRTSNSGADMLEFHGRLTGDAPCAGEVGNCANPTAEDLGSVVMEVTATSRAGARLLMLQEITLDVPANSICGHELSHGVLQLPR